MKEKLLITGGTGFVAFHIIEEALKQGYEVHVSTRPSSSTAHLKAFNLQYISINFADTKAIKDQLEAGQYDYIIHSAGTTRASNQQEYNQVNAEYTFNLAQAANASNIPLKKFVFVSSLAAVGPVSIKDVIDENTTLNPVTEYGKSKLLAEKMLAEIKDLPLITVRPTAVYGPREKDIFIVLKTITRGLEPYIGSNPQELSFVYVKDLAKLLVNVLHAPVNNKAYNVSDGLVYDKFQLASITKKITGKKTLRLQLPVLVIKLVAGLLDATSSITKKTHALNRDKIKELTASWNCNIDAAKSDLNFLPAYDLQTGLRETLQWYKDNNWIRY